MHTTYRLISPKDLDSGLTESWRSIQRAHEHLANPYFCPEFTQLVAHVRQDVQIVMLEQGGRPVGFFPFQRSRMGLGKPVGGPFSDYHGLIMANAVDCDLQALMRTAGISAWIFDHVPASMTAFVPYASTHATSPVIDLSTGYESYLQRFRETGSDYVSRAQRMARKLEREIGPLSFSLHESDESVVQQVLDWKDAQYLRSKSTTVFKEHGWTGSLLRAIAKTQEPHFSGMCSVLRADGRVVAVHLGMRSQHVLHWWFPTYDIAFEKYSPGTLLLLRIVEATEAAGIRLIDLGKGDSRYKTTAMTGSIALLEGSIERPSMLARWRQLHRIVEARAVQGGMLARGLNLPFRAVRRYERLTKFR